MFEMETLMDLEEWKQEWTLARRIGRGMTHKIYRISDRHVAKIRKGYFFTLRDDERTIEDLEKEYSIALDVYNLNISVPKPEGVFRIKLQSFMRPVSWVCPEYLPAFVMEYIGGIIVAKLKGDEKERVWKLVEGELRKARACKYDPVDGDRDYGGEWDKLVGSNGERNALWQPETDKVFLIDLASWRKY